MLLHQRPVRLHSPLRKRTNAPLYELSFGPSVLHPMAAELVDRRLHIRLEQTPEPWSPGTSWPLPFQHLGEGAVAAVVDLACSVAVVEAGLAGHLRRRASVLSKCHLATSHHNHLMALAMAVAMEVAVAAVL